MSSCYVDYTTRSIADLVDYYGLGMLITRINVPPKERGKGAGAKLLKAILADADRTYTTLFLEVVPTGEMTEEQLTGWYGRHGFKYWKGVFRRQPRWKSMQENPIFPKKRHRFMGHRVKIVDPPELEGLLGTVVKVDSPHTDDENFLVRTDNGKEHWLWTYQFEDVTKGGMTENPVYPKRRWLSKFKVGDRVSVTWGLRGPSSGTTFYGTVERVNRYKEGPSSYDVLFDRNSVASTASFRSAYIREEELRGSPFAENPVYPKKRFKQDIPGEHEEIIESPSTALPFTSHKRKYTYHSQGEVFLSIGAGKGYYSAPLINTDDFKSYSKYEVALLRGDRFILPSEIGIIGFDAAFGVDKIAAYMPVEKLLELRLALSKKFRPPSSGPTPPTDDPQPPLPDIISHALQGLPPETARIVQERLRGMIGTRRRRSPLEANPIYPKARPILKVGDVVMVMKPGQILLDRAVGRVAHIIAVLEIGRAHV